MAKSWTRPSLAYSTWHSLEAWQKDKNCTSQMNDVDQNLGCASHGAGRRRDTAVIKSLLPTTYLEVSHLAASVD